MYTLLKQVAIREELLKRDVRIFTFEIFSQIFKLSAHKTKYLLESQVKEGLLLRLKRGLYALKTDPPNEEEIANSLYKPSYLSFEYALGYHNILPEMSYVVTSATTKATRLFTLEEKAFSYRSIGDEAYTGYQLVKKDNRSIYMAEPEKALADYLYFVTLGKIPPSERLVLRDVDKLKIIKYADLYGFHKDRLRSLIRKVI